MKLKPRETHRQRCAICHDGPDGLVICQGCKTHVHAQCLIQHGTCPTPGCHEKDPLQDRPWSVGQWLRERRERRNARTEVRSDSCAIHGEMSEECPSDLRRIWGHNRCTCTDDLKEHRAIRRAEDGPRVEPHCEHKWDDEGNHCVYCHTSPPGSLDPPWVHHEPPHYYGYKKETFAKVTRCQDCRRTALYEDQHPVNPCPSCGGPVKQSDVAGRWMGTYWQSSKEAAVDTRFWPTPDIDSDCQHCGLPEDLHAGTDNYCPENAKALRAYCSYTDPDSEFFQESCSCGEHKITRDWKTRAEIEKMKARIKKRKKAVRSLCDFLIMIGFILVAIVIGLIKSCAEGM